MKQVTITTRAVYHKVASVTIDVPSTVKDNEIHDWLLSNEELFVSELDTNISKAEFDFGFGLYDGMDWADCESETRYDLIEDNKIKLGGHL
jgi:hypothetical protein